MQVVLLTNDNQSKEYLTEIFLGKVDFCITSYIDVLFSKYSDCDIVITDDLEHTKTLCDKGKKVLAIAKNPDFVKSLEFLKLGAKGFANTRMQEIHYKDAISCIQNGGIWVLPEIVLGMVKVVNLNYKDTENQAFNLLSEREKIVAGYIKDGLSNAQIADKLGLSVRTIKAESSSIYQKFGVKNRVALVMALKDL